MHKSRPYSRKACPNGDEAAYSSPTTHISLSVSLLLRLQSDFILIVPENTQDFPSFPWIPVTSTAFGSFNLNFRFWVIQISFKSHSFLAANLIFVYRFQNPQINFTFWPSVVPFWCVFRSILGIIDDEGRENGQEIVFWDD